MKNKFWFQGTKTCLIRFIWRKDNYFMGPGITNDCTISEKFIASLRSNESGSKWLVSTQPLDEKELKALSRFDSHPRNNRHRYKLNREKLQDFINDEHKYLLSSIQQINRRENDYETA